MRRINYYYNSFWLNFRAYLMILKSCNNLLCWTHAAPQLNVVEFIYFTPLFKAYNCMYYFVYKSSLCIRRGATSGYQKCYDVQHGGENCIYMFMCVCRVGGNACNTANHIMLMMRTTTWGARYFIIIYYKIWEEL